ncbi:hypothetical protein NDU88_002881 [Pleurodeles waltl]|uniref:Uncharacterized protein n=1 Tax=Pleurodeles waltl TaxID=8319 RepID=A0AAV7RDC9_PLEWA|nr:hypothetical protein NDU88_002881 [Pleurodeles waltl]
MEETDGDREGVKNRAAEDEVETARTCLTPPGEQREPGAVWSRQREEDYWPREADEGVVAKPGTAYRDGRETGMGGGQAKENHGVCTKRVEGRELTEIKGARKRDESHVVKASALDIV